MILGRFSPRVLVMDRRYQREHQLANPCGSGSPAAARTE
jgi:hypothetical protein